MVVLHDFHLTLTFIFAKSNSLHTLVDLIFLLILSIHMTLILSYPSLHFHYLTFLIFLSKRAVSFYDINRTREQLSTHTKEGGLPPPTRRQSESRPTR